MRREVNRNSARKNDTMTHRYHAPQNYRVKAYKNTRAACFRFFLCYLQHVVHRRFPFQAKV